MKDVFLKGRPSGLLGGAHNSGWMTAPNFELILKHFVKFVRCSKENMVLMTQKIIKITFSQFPSTWLKIKVLCSYYTSLYQQQVAAPRSSCIWPFKNSYNTTANEWFCSHPRRSISIYYIAEILCKALPLAFCRGTSVRNICKEF